MDIYRRNACLIFHFNFYIVRNLIPFKPNFKNVSTNREYRTVVGGIIAACNDNIDTHCPTVTSTATVCSTCAVKECLAYSTISNPCDCVEPVPTKTTSYPCSQTGSCPKGCATTIYVSATSSSLCSSDIESSETSSNISTDLPSNLCPTVTSTNYVCETCSPHPYLCTATSKIKRPCKCPIATSWTSYPCSESCVTSNISTTSLATSSSTDSSILKRTGSGSPSPGCPTGCRSTTYVFDDDCSTPVDTSTVTCTPTVTVSSYPTEGCPYSCITDWRYCIYDGMAFFL